MAPHSFCPSAFPSAHSRSTRLHTWLRACVAAAVVLAGCGTPGPTPVPGSGTGAPLFVRGYLFATVAGAANTGTGEQIFLPGATVTLRDHNAAAPLATVRTDLSGRFSFSPVPAGNYRLCWQHPGLAPGCLPDDVVVTTQAVLTGPVAATLATLPGMRAVFGSVSAVKGAVRTLEPMFGVNAYARVTVVDASGSVRDTAYVNTFGDYVLTRVPARGASRVIASLEGARAEQALASGTTAARVDLKFRNSAPRVELIHTVAGKRVRNAAPGTVVEVEARGFDPDGDTVRFLWYTTRPGAAERTGERHARWRLSSERVANSLYVLASDGQGGYTPVNTVIPGSSDARFAGRVRDSGAADVAGAEVEVNGVRTRSGPNGRFMVDVPYADRYVLNVRKPGHTLVSRVYTEPVGDGTWVVTRGTVVLADPTQPIDVVDAREFQRCEDPLQLPREQQGARDSARIPRYQDAAGIVTRVGREPLRRPSRTRGCGPGARLQIPANALVDAQGNAPAGPVEVMIFTVDPQAPFDMPGDWTAVDGAGERRVMETYGAAIVEVTGGGLEYNLRPGAEALLTIPIDPAQLAAPAPEPDDIPLLVYDEAQGVWRPEGTLTRSGAAYVARVGHFSAFNADLLLVGAACIQIYTPTLPSLYNLEVTVPQTPGAAPRVFTLLVDNTVPYHVLYNLPVSVDITLVPYSTVNQVFGTYVVNTGTPQNPAAPNPPLYPYDACAGTAQLEHVGVPVAGPNAFLHGLYSFAASDLNDLDPVSAANLDATSTAYYSRIDPLGLRTTLAAFQQQNGFPANEIHAVYANSADLGFGRDMHCRRSLASDAQFDVACYVTNYGNEPSPDGADFLAAAAGTAPGLTVAMEYSRIEATTTTFVSNTRVVKFYVFDAGGAPRVNAADLDGFGPRPVPQLCVVCHGGDVPGGTAPGFPNTASANMGSVFIPFDLSGFTIVDGVTLPQFDKIAQQNAFRRLNQEIVLATLPGAANQEIITGMYPTASPLQKEDFVVAGWSGDAADQAFYLDVVRPSCRTCHASRLPGPTINFTASSQFLNSSIGFRVCQQRVMPHALRTYMRFWGSVSPHQPAHLNAYGDAKLPPVGFVPDCKN